MTEGVFLSYSSRDRAELDDLLSALRRADEQVWFDEELGGGEVWWQQILERIRGCDVFLFALSNNSLESKPCLTELGYAQALQKPVLPIQIGPVQSMRVSPLAAVEAIDFQNPTIDSGIRLMTAMQRAKRRSAPLPSPLPGEPPVPFAYLMRLASTINGAELDPQQQSDLLTELKTFIARDADDAGAQRDIAQLLRSLHDRSDATEATRTESERLLAQLGDLPGAAGPSHSRSASPQHPAGSRKWLLAAVATVAVVAAIVTGVVITRHRSAPTVAAPTPTMAAPVSPEDLDAILLSQATVTTVMGAANMQGDPPDGSMFSPTSTLSDPDCLGTDYAAAQPVYAGSGWSAVSNQVLSQPRPDDPDSSLFWVNQAAVSFPTDRQARDFLNNSANRWEGCSGRVVKDDDDTAPAPWSFADLTRNQDTIAQLSFQEGAGGWACQHALAVHANAVLEVVACGDHVRDQASRLVEKMVDNVKA